MNAMSGPKALSQSRNWYIQTKTFNISRAPNLLSFKGVPSPPSWCFRGYFLPPLHQLGGYYSVFRAASPSQAMGEDSKSYFECSIWILTVKCNAHGFSQYYNFQKQKMTMLENIGYITELTALHFYQGHMSGTCVWRGENRSHFFRLMYSTKF